MIDESRSPAVGAVTREVAPLVAAVSALGRDPMPRIPPGLASVEVNSVWRLCRDNSAGVLILPKRLPSLTARELPARLATAPAGVGPAIAQLSRAPWGRDLASLALRQTVGEPSVRQLGDNALNTLLAAAPGTSPTTARVVLSLVHDLGEGPGAADDGCVTSAGWLGRCHCRPILSSQDDSQTTAATRGGDGTRSQPSGRRCRNGHRLPRLDTAA